MFRCNTDPLTILCLMLMFRCNTDPLTTPYLMFRCNKDPLTTPHSPCSGNRLWPLRSRSHSERDRQEMEISATSLHFAGLLSVYLASLPRFHASEGDRVADNHLCSKYGCSKSLFGSWVEVRSAWRTNTISVFLPLVRAESRRQAARDVISQVLDRNEDLNGFW